MPIYEYYCERCHMIFNFLARRLNVTTQPSCPKCGKPKLQRRISRFSISKGRPEKSDEEFPEGEEDQLDGLPPGFDEKRFEKAIMELADEAEHIDENNPRQMAQLMRKLFDKTGLPLGNAMEEAIRRMEAGEDPDRIEEELGDELEQEEETLFGNEEQLAEKMEKPSKSRPRRNPEQLSAAVRRKLGLPPKVDDKLYELQ